MAKWECERYSHDEWVSALSKVIPPDCKDWKQSPTPDTAAALHKSMRAQVELAWTFGPIAEETLRRINEATSSQFIMDSLYSTGHLDASLSDVAKVVSRAIRRHLDMDESE